MLQIILVIIALSVLIGILRFIMLVFIKIGEILVDLILKKEYEKAKKISGLSIQKLKDEDFIVIWKGFWGVFVFYPLIMYIFGFWDIYHNFITLKVIGVYTNYSYLLFDSVVFALGHTVLFLPFMTVYLMIINIINDIKKYYKNKREFIDYVKYISES